MRAGAMLASAIAVGSMIGIAYLGCDASPGKPATSPMTTARGETIGAIDKGKAPLASKAYYRLDLGPTEACVAGAACTATFVVTALADYHVNPEYPTKFVPTSAPELGVQSPGAFAIDGEHHGVMKVELHPAKAGAYTLEGKLKLSVCNAANCQIEAPVVAIPIVAS